MNFEIGKWLFNSETNELVSGRETISLENRTGRVLEYLCQNPGRVISRDELLDQVWGRQALSEHSVSIVISDLRKALGDQAKKSAIIKTIPKKGYLFTPPSPKQNSERMKPGRRWLGGVAAALLVAGFLLFSYFKSEDPQTIVFYDIESTYPSEEGKFMAESLTEILLAELSKIPELRVIRIRPPERPLRAGTNPVDQFLESDQMVLVGAINPANEGFIFTMRLEKGPENEILWGFNEELVENYYYLSGRRAIQILGSEMGWQVQGNPVVKNERAERLFWRSVYLWESREAQDTRASHQTLLEALDLEPGFSRAHAQLATIYAHKTGPYLGFESLSLFDLAENHLAAAEEGGAQLPEINISRALIAFYRDREYEKALTYLDEGLKRWPHNVLLWHTRGMVTSAMGRHDESLFSIEKARRLDPLSHSLNWDRVWFLYLAGQFEEALQAAEETEQFTADVHHYYVALIQEALGNQREALNQWLRLIEDVGIELPFPEVRPGEEVDYPERYKTLLDAVEADGRSFYPNAVKVFWAYLSGDQKRTFNLLETIPIEQENWVFYWLPEIPLLSPLKEQKRFLVLLSP